MSFKNVELDGDGGEAIPDGQRGKKWSDGPKCSIWEEPAGDVYPPPPKDTLM